MPTFKPFNQVDEYDVINLFAYTGSFPVNKGTFVKPAGSGWMPSLDIEMMGSVGASYGNTVSQRYGTAAKVGPVTSSGDKTIGMLLYDGRETDENGEKLIFNPRKQAEMEVFVSGNTAPIVAKGTFLYSGIVGTVIPGDFAYLANDGSISVTGGGTTTATKVGQFLGGKNAEGFALVKIDV